MRCLSIHWYKRKTEQNITMYWLSVVLFFVLVPVSMLQGSKMVPDVKVGNKGAMAGLSRFRLRVVDPDDFTTKRPTEIVPTGQPAVYPAGGFGTSVCFTLTQLIGITAMIAVIMMIMVVIASVLFCKMRRMYRDIQMGLHARYISPSIITTPSSFLQDGTPYTVLREGSDVSTKTPGSIVNSSLSC